MFCYHVHDRFGYRRGRSYETGIVQEAGEDGISWREWADMIGMIHTVRSAGSPNPQAYVLIVQLVSTGTR